MEIESTFVRHKRDVEQTVTSSTEDLYGHMLNDAAKRLKMMPRIEMKPILMDRVYVCTPDGIHIVLANQFLSSQEGMELFLTLRWKIPFQSQWVRLSSHSAPHVCALAYCNRTGGGYYFYGGARITCWRLFPEIIHLMERLNHLLQYFFSSCLLVYYEDGVEHRKHFDSHRFFHHSIIERKQKRSVILVLGNDQESRICLYFQ